MMSTSRDPDEELGFEIMSKTEDDHEHV